MNLHMFETTNKLAILTYSLGRLLIQQHKILKC